MPVSLGVRPLGVPECGGADQEMLQSGAGTARSRRALQRPFLQRKGVECCSRERTDCVHRPGGERGQGINITRLFRGFCISEFEERIIDCCPPLPTQISSLQHLQFLLCEIFFPQLACPWAPSLPSGKAFPSHLPCFPPTIYFSLSLYDNWV